jgi:outer membrane protein TolC
MFAFLPLVACLAAAPELPDPQPYTTKTPVKMRFAEAITEAQAHNVSAAVARREVDRAMGLLEQARAASLPVLTGQGGLARLNAARALGNNTLAGQNQRNAALNINVPLVAPRAWGNWAEARTTANIAHAGDANVRRQVSITAARAYLAIITQTNIVAVEQVAVETDRAHAEYAQARFSGGVGNRLDQLRADQELANSEAQLQNALAGLAQAQEALGVLVGRATPVDVADDMPLSPAGPQQEALQTAETLRADVRMAQGQMHQAEQVRRNTWLDFAPSIVGTANLFHSFPGTPSVPLNGWELQLLLQVPLYDGGARYGAMAVRDAAQAEAQLRLDNALRQARSEVRLAYETVAHSEAALKASQRGAESAAEALKLANAAYHAGTTGNLEVIDAERVNRDAQTTAIVAQDSVRKARLDLITAAGKFP